MGLISMLSLLGFDISLVRFPREREDKEIIDNDVAIYEEPKSLLKGSIRMFS